MVTCEPQLEAIPSANPSLPCNACTSVQEPRETKRLTRKISRLPSFKVVRKVIDVTPKNADIVAYCQRLIDLRERGKQDKLTRKLSVIELLMRRLIFHEEEPVTLATAIKDIDRWLRRRSYKTIPDDPSQDRELGRLLIQLHRARDPSKARSESETLKFTQDAIQFIKIYKRRGQSRGDEGHSQAMHHDDYWASKQQLLSGKVIADFIDPEYGPLDPAFGVLLNPTTGRWGPGDSGLLHYLFHKDDRAEAYHTAVHDAFGYLISEHGIGPGYNYLGTKNVLGPQSPYSGQLSGYNFWLNLMSKTRDRRKSKMGA